MEKLGKRMMSISAVAVLAVFGVAQTSQADPILVGPSTYVDIADVAVHQDAPSVFLDVDSDGTDDFELYMLGTADAWYVRYRMIGLNGAIGLNNAAQGSDQYFRTFGDGDVIDVSNTNVQPGGTYAPIPHCGTADLGDLAEDRYVGFQLSGGEYGWFHMKYFRDGVSPDVGYAEVYDYAYTPEPASLGLLVVGAGALAFRRR